MQNLGLGIYRTIYYLPSITPAVAFAVVWVQILNLVSARAQRIFVLVWAGAD